MTIVNGLITLADAKLSLGAVTGTDADIESYISAATPVIENVTGPMYARSVTYVVDGGRGSLVLPVRFNAVTSVVESGVTVTDYVADGAAGVIYGGTTAGGRAFRDGIRNVTVTVTVGYATIPPHVQIAARELVRHWWQQGRQGNRPGFGNEPTVDIGGVSFGVPTRRLEELLGSSPSQPGFA